MTEQSDDIVIERVDYAARRKDRAAGRKKSSRRHVYVLIGVALAVMLAVFGAVEAIASSGRVHPGVTVAGVKIGGMTPGNAVAALRTSLPSKVGKPVVIVYSDKNWKVTADQVGLGFDLEGTVDEAMKVGRSGNFLQMLGQRFAAWGGAEVAPIPTADPAAMAAVIDTVAQSTDVEPRNATVRIEGTETKVIDGEDGRAVDRSELASDVLVAFISTDRSVKAPVGVAKMRVTRADAEAAQKVVEQMLSAPATVKLADKSWEFTPAQIGDWIDFEVATQTVEASGAPALRPFVSAEFAEEPVLDSLGAEVGRPAKDASFKTSNGRVTILPSQEGVGPDVAALADSLTEELSNPASARVVELRTHRTDPKLTTEKARQMGVKERISTYSTTYAANNAPRVNNIHLLGDSLDGKLIPPGETFSFNGYVGERTAAKGYKEANAIVKGKLVPQLGGGICQVGTTLFNAIFESGLPVVERHNHSFYIDHYPKGRDATVSWGGPDLKFKNETDSWILISVSYTSSSITISLYGTDPGYDVASRTSGWSNERPFPTETIKDPLMYVGTKITEDGGITGRTVSVERTVTKDGKVVRTDTFVSKYQPKVQVVRIGTKPKPSKTATATR